MRKTKESYTIGYGKPPKHTRFKKGQSGNPRGRARGSRSFLRLLADALGERVVINEGNRRKTITKLEAVAKQFANKGASGDLKALKALLELIQQIERERQAWEPERQHPPGPPAREIVMEKLRKMSERMKANGEIRR
jgi:hypothetical protein